jgi:hypothetical protein
VFPPTSSIIVGFGFGFPETIGAMGGNGSGVAFDIVDMAAAKTFEWSGFHVPSVLSKNMISHFEIMSNK